MRFVQHLIEGFMPNLEILSVYVKGHVTNGKAFAWLGASMPRLREISLHEGEGRNDRSAERQLTLFQDLVVCFHGCANLEKMTFGIDFTMVPLTALRAKFGFMRLRAIVCQYRVCNPRRSITVYYRILLLKKLLVLLDVSYG